MSMNRPNPVLIASRCIMRSDYLPITISRSWSAIIQLVRVVQHAGATHEHKRGARFPVNFHCCDILPTLAENNNN